MQCKSTLELSDFANENIVRHQLINILKLHASWEMVLEKVVSVRKLNNFL